NASISLPRAVQLTLELITPHAVAHPLILEAINQQVLSNKFVIVRMRACLLRREDCQKFSQGQEGYIFLSVAGGIHGPWADPSLYPHPQGCHQLWRTVMGLTRMF
uniref:Uncharacterized protein n=1 Tax=Sus scrofa TaxID=9823 RepID=A0A4X1TLQ4_PIG